MHANPEAPQKPAQLAAAYSLAAIALSLFMFSPCLWLMTEYHPGTFQWDRAHSYLLQCAQPLRRDIEPAMAWRLLPPLVAHALGLRGKWALGIPITGAFLLLWYVSTLLLKSLPNRNFAFGGTVLFATTSGILVPLHWYGMNDAWVWLALLWIAFSPSRLALPIACVLAPWIDERFIIGLPVALLVRQLEGKNATGLRTVFHCALWLAPYAAIRLAGSFSSETDKAASYFTDYVKSGFLAAAPWAAIGWWMAFRLAWVPIGYAIRIQPWRLSLAGGLTLLAMLLLAADISRSAAILSPVLLLGLLWFARRHRNWLLVIRSLSGS